MLIQQISSDVRPPSGDSKPLAELRFKPEELVTRYKLRFEERFDDLDHFRLAVILLASGLSAWLYKYRGDVDGGTLVRVDAQANLAKAWEQLRLTLDLQEADFVWTAPEATPSRSDNGFHIVTQEVFPRWVLDALKARGGSASRPQIRKFVWDHHRWELERSDNVIYSWQLDVNRAIDRLRREGHILHLAHGIWALSSPQQ